MKETDDKYLSALELARKIEANSWARMWNDAMKSAGQRNFFYFSNPELVKEITEAGREKMKQLLKIFNKTENTDTLTHLSCQN